MKNILWIDVTYGDTETGEVKTERLVNLLDLDQHQEIAVLMAGHVPACAEANRDAFDKTILKMVAKRVESYMHVRYIPGPSLSSMLRRLLDAKNDH